MASAIRRPASGGGGGGGGGGGAAVAQAEIALLPSLKNCLVNLPSSLVQLLMNSDTVAQNVIVEVSWRQPVPASVDTKQKPQYTLKSVYLGWTGMQSRTRPGSVALRNGTGSVRGGSAGGRKEQDVALVELDSTFGRLVGLTEGMKVCCTTGLWTLDDMMS